MRPSQFKLCLAILAVATLASFSPNFVQADHATAAIQEEGDGVPFLIPTTYSGTNGGAEDLSLMVFPTLPPAATEGFGTLGLWDFSLTGGTPGGSGLIASSLAPANVNSFGLSFLIAIDPTNLLTFAYFGFGFMGDLYVPAVSQSVPALAGNTVYIQAYEYAPVARTSNGVAFPLTF